MIIKIAGRMVRLAVALIVVFAVLALMNAIGVTDFVDQLTMLTMG